MKNTWFHHHLHVVLLLLISKRTFAYIMQQPHLNRGAATTPPTQLYAVIPRKAAAPNTIIAGRLWGAISKFRITPAKAKEILQSIKQVTEWQDIVLLGVLAFCSMPFAYWSYERKLKVEGNDEDCMIVEGEELDDVVEEKPELLSFSALRRFGIAKILSQFCKVALSVYAMDVVSTILTTLGFHFPNAWCISSLYAKIAYTIFFLKQFLVAKKICLCRWFKVDSENMGRVELLDRLLNGVSFTVISLVLFDWLSVKMGMAVKSLFAFGSVGTLAFTLASRDLVSSLLSGIFLTASQKMYVGDLVVFGDGTSGKVLKLGWMETVLRGGDNIVTRVPNTMLSNQKVSNLSRLTMSQVKLILRFHYEDVEKIPALLETIRAEIIKSCPRLVRNGTRPFRVFWTDINEDHLEVTVDTHHQIAPVGDAYWQNRQAVLMAVQRAIKTHDLELAKLYTFATSLGGRRENQRRSLPKGSRIEEGRQESDEEPLVDEDFDDSG